MSFAVVLPLRLAQNVERSPPLKHVLNAGAEIPLVAHHVDAFAQITFIMSVTTAERSEMGGREKRGRLPVLFEGAFGAEKLEAGHPTFEVAKRTKPVPEQPVLAPKRMRDQAEPPLLVDFTNRASQII